MKENFKASLAAVLKHEGGYVDHLRDPGGATNMGITRHTLAAWRGMKIRDLPKTEVKWLTLAEASEIYKARYWDMSRCDDLPSGVDLVVFDGSVNSGPRRSIKWLQGAIEVKRDGVLGPVTLKATVAMSADQVVDRILATRLAWLKRLKTWPTFGKGWAKRITRVKREAMSMSKIPPPPDIPKPIAPKPKPSALDEFTGRAIGGWIAGLALVGAALLYFFK